MAADDLDGYRNYPDLGELRSGGPGETDLVPVVMANNLNSQTAMSRRQLRDLEIEIGFLEGVVRRAPDYVEALQILGDDYTRRGNFSGGLWVDQQLARLRPDDPTVHYNLACSYSILEQIPRAITSLLRAIDLGYRDFRWLDQDPDLEKLRQHTLFKKVRTRIRSLRNRRRASPSDPPDLSPK